LIVCNQITQLEKDKYLTPREYKKILETFQDYQKHIHSKVINENVPWIENILNGQSEQESILFKDSDFVMLPDISWNKQDVQTMHCLAIVTDRNLKSIRDLTQASIPLLLKIEHIGCQIINEKYHVNKDKLLIYFHYHPSYLHLHVHFTYLVNNQTLNGFTLRVHSLHDVIKNLRADNLYYQKDIEILL